jgi:N-acetyl-gamma-glutamylphosphate reductase
LANALPDVTRTVTLPLIVVGVTGALLVYGEEIDRAMDPRLFHVTPASTRVSAQGLYQRIQAEYPSLAEKWRTAYGLRTAVAQGLHLGERTTLVFVPHLLPIPRGIYSTMHVGFTSPVTAEELTQLYADTYADQPFVHVLPAGKLPELKDVVNTPRAEIGFQLLQGGRRAVIVSVIDNLLKGAASQAVQNFNRMCGYPETEGLL